MAELKENTVQHTLCMPLWGRIIAEETYPHIFPDHDAGRICKELGVDWSDNMFGYLKDGYRPTWITKLFHKVMQVFHMSFMLHVEFKED